ncbi:radical SAM/SPASM domain-containing protein [Tropicibacter oceani]|uniref:Radical SAM protein n=1 Tax=Tropicibacter oceani TaxID=3058420 RepID=A0ABY8QQA9_9RHOB|nr:radical SAM protein [Tropicibacter oceani]WGW05997.1 radical SAM protein [Tropicibacter oceani]
MTRVLRISDAGYSVCPDCGRHVLLRDQVEDTRCPFCGAGILDRATGPAAGTLAHLARLPGRAGVMCRALLAAGGGAGEGARAVPRDAALDGDPARFPRNLDGDDRASPRHVVWELTLACDLKCLHCGSRAGARRRDELDTAQCLDLVHEMADMGIREVTLIGGEAYMRRDWAQIAAAITRAGMGCSMTTGARSFDARRLAQAVDAGIAVIGVSIDGLEATHDALRGVPGSWRMAVEASERIAASPIRLATNTQINALSAPELAGVARLMAEVGSASWQVQLTVAMGQAADRPDLLLQPDDLLEIFPLLVWTRETILDPAGIALVMGNNIGYFSPFEPALRYGGDIGVHWSGCSAGAQVLGIEADGTVKGCPSLATQDFSAGRAGRQALARIVAEAPEITRFAQRGAGDLTGYCADCPYAQICRAGCSWTAHSLMGRTGDNPYCIHRALDRDALGLRETLVKLAEAPGLPFDTGRFALRKTAARAADRRPGVLGVPLAQVIAADAFGGGLQGADRLQTCLSPSRRAAPVDSKRRLHHGKET